MATINFYHVAGDTPASTDAILPRLLEKGSAAQNLLLVCNTEQRQHRLDDVLWTFSPTSFLAHCTPENKYAGQSPIVVAQPENAVEKLAEGRLPVVLAGAEDSLAHLLPTAEKLLYVFHSAPQMLDKSRELWKQLKTQNHTLTYWQQTDKGWQQKQ